MKDETKEQLISELEEMRRRVAELWKGKAQRKQAVEELGKYREHL